MSEETFDELPRLSDWLLRRVWPRALPDLEAALQNFRFIAQDLEAVVAWSESRRSGQVLVDRVYAESIYDEDTYKFLRRRSDYYRDLAADLAIELTRAVNLVADRVREHLWPSYRLSEGYAIVGLGLNADLSYQTLRPLYALDAPPQPYPGLQRFLMERGSRDYAVGEGGPPDGTAMPAMRISGQRGGDGDA